MRHFLVFVVMLYGNMVLATETDSTFKPHGNMLVQLINRTEFNLSTGVGGMYINRSHIGYLYQFAPQWLGKIVLDAGRPTVLGNLQFLDSNGVTQALSYSYNEGSYYTMALKFSYLQWKPNQKITLQMGGILQNHYITQEKFWQHRYICETFQDRYFGTPSGDLGIIGYYSPNSWFSIDLALTNGEGFRINQDAGGKMKWAAGIDLLPTKWLQLRVYYDRKYFTLFAEDRYQSVFSAFAGIRPAKNIRAGFEMTYLEGFKGSTGRELFGFSVFTAWSPLKSVEAFVRYDLLDSNGLDGGVGGWNKENDGQLLLTGLHYTVVKGIGLSLNYRQHFAAAHSSSNDYGILSFAFEYKLN